MITAKSVQVFTQRLEFVGSDDWWPVEHQPYWDVSTTSPFDLVKIVHETMVWARTTQTDCLVDVVLYETASVQPGDWPDWKLVLTWRWDPRRPELAWQLIPPDPGEAEDEL